MEVVAIMAQMLSFHFQRMEQKRHGSCLHIIVDLGVVEFVSGGLDIVGLVVSEVFTKGCGVECQR